MSIISMSGQAKLFLLTVGAGCGLGFIYDLFRIFRKTVRHSDFMTNVEDILYWIIVSLAMFYFLLGKNYGEIRYYTILGAFSGMGLYFLTLSRVVLKVSVTVIEFFKKVLSAAVKILLLPFRLLVNILKVPARFIFGVAGKSARRGKRVLQKSGKYAKIRGRKLKHDLRIIFKKV